MSTEPRIQLEDGGAVVAEIYKDSNGNLVLEDNENNIVETVPFEGKTDVLLVRGSSTDINDSNIVTWDNTVINDSAYSFDGTVVTFDEAGVYEIRADADFGANNERVNPNLSTFINDNRKGPMGRSGYIRNAYGHTTSSVHATLTFNASSGDTLYIQGHQGSNVGEVVSPTRSQLIIKKLQ